MRRPPLTSRLAGFGTSVFAEMTDLAKDFRLDTSAIEEAIRCEAA